jgi:hypothetical protein
VVPPSAASRTVDRAGARDDGQRELHEPADLLPHDRPAGARQLERQLRDRIVTRDVDIADPQRQELLRIDELPGLLRDVPRVAVGLTTASALPGRSTPASIG